MKMLLLLFFLPMVNTDLSKVRQLYKVAPLDETKAEELSVIANKNCTSNSVFMGYKGAAKMILAKYGLNPIAKWALFKDGKEILELAISSDSKNIELIYLRSTIQNNSPDFLGYKNNIIEDKQYLMQHINRVNDIELKNIIKSYLLSSNQ